jgi:hypothetical protein
MTMVDTSLLSLSSTAQESPRGFSAASAGGGEPVSSSYENSNSSSESSDADVSPSPSPSGVRTWLQKGIRHPKQYTDGTVRYGMLSSAGKPYTLT